MGKTRPRGQLRGRRRAKPTLPPRCHHHRRHLPHPLPRIPAGSSCSAWTRLVKAGWAGWARPLPEVGGQVQFSLPGVSPARMLLHLPRASAFPDGWPAGPRGRGPPVPTRGGRLTPGAREGGLLRPPSPRSSSACRPHEALDYHFGPEEGEGIRDLFDRDFGTSLPLDF